MYLRKTIGANWRHTPTPETSDPDPTHPIVDPAGEFPERTIDEIADSTRPDGVEVDDWRDENLEAITQLSIPPEVSRPSLWVTAGTLVPFAVLLSWMTGWGWQQTALIVVLVVIHEAGHLIAKKAFGYTDLQLFFIPFIGAAVSGRKDDATQTQRAIVALAGPVPSVIVSAGYLIGCYRGMIEPHDLSMRIALVALIINGFNLIPLGPLDGGQFFSAIFFWRWPWMDVACKILAIAALILVGIGSPWVSFAIAAFIFTTLRTTYNISVLSHRLRAAGLNRDSSLDTMSLEHLMQSYALARDLVNDSSAPTLERRVALRAGLVQRAYPGAIAKPASPAGVIVLLALYLSVSTFGGYSWYLHDKAMRAAEALRLAAPLDDEPDEQRFKILNDRS